MCSITRERPTSPIRRNSTISFWSVRTEAITIQALTWNMDLRLVVVARKVRPNESPDVDTERIVKKDSVKFFDAYYEIFGQLWKGRTWDISLVKGMDEYLRENGLEDDPADYV